MRRANQNRQQLPTIGGGNVYSGMAAQPSIGSRTIDASSAIEFSHSGMDIGISSKQGKRPYQEDEFACKALISSGLGGKNASETHFVGLFDGHAGGRCSKYLAAAMAQTLSEDPQFDTNLPQAMKRSFHTINDNFLKVADKIRLQDGSTGICVVMREEKYLVANVGDCRALVVSNGQAVQLSKDQKPTSPEEQKRIYALGGTVVNCMGVIRVNGVLAVSRAFGNRSLRDVIRPDAEITQRSMGLMDEFLIMASDGLWDVLSNAAVAEICQRMAAMPAAAIAEELVNTSIARGSMDNVTCICIKLAKFMGRVLDEGTHKAMSGGGGGGGGARERTASNASDLGDPNLRRAAQGQSQDISASSSSYQNRTSPSPSTMDKMTAGASDSVSGSTPLMRPVTTNGPGRSSGYGQLSGGGGYGQYSHDRLSPHSWRNQPDNINSLNSNMTYTQQQGGVPVAPQPYGHQPYGQTGHAVRKDAAGGGAYGTNAAEQGGGNRYMAAYNSYHREREDHIKMSKELLDSKSSASQINAPRPASQSSSSGYGQNNRTIGSLSNVAFRSISGGAMSANADSLSLPPPSNRLLHSPITTKAKGTKYTGRASTANTVSRRSVIKRREV